MQKYSFGSQYFKLIRDPLHLQALAVEFFHTHGVESSDGKSELRTFMESQGYSVRAEVTHSGGRANDLIFVQDGFKPDVKLYNIHNKKRVTT